MTRMKKLLLSSVLMLSCWISTQAQLPVIEIIKQASVKVIKAVDLMVQRWQNETIWLQNAQQALENALEKTKLLEISDWVDRQRTLYADYFDELSKVKTVIAEYHRVKSIVEMQARLVREYQGAFALFKNDKHFTADEIAYMEKVYAGILEKSIQNMNRIQLVVKALTTKMTDAQRLAIIDQAAVQVNQNYSDLQAFNNQNKLLSLQRAKNEDEVNQVKAMYGL
jgi:hypothetical protein